MLGTRSLLGLAIDEFGIVVAELGVRSGHPEVLRAGQWRFEKKLSPDNAKDLGQELRQFLRTNHFSSKQAVIGIPTKWIVAKEISVPPASTEALAGVLNIQAERAFSLNASELVFDYCGRTSASERSEVLLLAARREIVDQIKELAASAGLRVRSVTVSALALGFAVSRASCPRSEGGTPSTRSDGSLEHRYGLYTRPTYCEFWTQINGSPRCIQHVPLAATQNAADEHVELLTSTIQRLVLLSPQQDSSSPHRVTAYDGSGLPSNTIERLNQLLEPEITVADGSTRLWPEGTGSSDRADQAQSVAAVALAIAATGTDKPSVDFVNPRIGLSKKKISRAPVTVWAGIIGGACLLVLILVLADWQADRRDIAAYTEQLELMKDDIDAARQVVDRISYATSWTSQEPVFLNCLRELTLTFPEEPSIWATSLRLSADAGGALVGKAVDEESFYEVLDKIKQNEAFFNVQMIHLRNVGRDLGEKEFAVNFEFRGAK
jgi:hypothetical protein